MYRKNGRHFGLLSYMKQIMARDGDNVSTLLGHVSIYANFH